MAPLNAVALGGADCVWDDLGRIPEDWPDLYGACNEAGTITESLHHWVTLHPERMAAWEAERAGRGLSNGYVTWTRVMPRGAEHREDLVDRTVEGWKGSSGLLLVQALVEAGADRVVCCGMPMDASAHFFDEQGWQDWNLYRVAWARRWRELGNVRSVSGWTRELLGGPEEWFNGD